MPEDGPAGNHAASFVVCHSRPPRRPVLPMSKLLGLAVFLLILWVVLWVFLKITGLFLHLLWIAAIILAVMWLIGKLRGGK
jgi:hypothetical protein